MSKLKPSADFTPIAHRYDETRNTPVQILKDAYETLQEVGILPEKSQILDAGCGTGQLSIPLVESGFSVCGVDISEAMIKIAQSKIHPSSNASYGVGDVQSLSFTNDSFDAVVVSKLFQHVGNWQRSIDELIRVTKPGGYIIHIRDQGAFRNTVRRKMEELANEAGFNNRYVGVQNREDIQKHFLSNGCSLIEVGFNKLTWEKQVTYDLCLTELREKLFAEFWVIPDEFYNGLLQKLEAWINVQQLGRETNENLLCQLKIDVFRVK
ncbi:class I SAM-dependent methyltransferase [Brevibacillus sp. NRS-1366]|uniref:class I SAM-dependent methyltransferase n=1 Tax=Brevibacillus sp. NRS-1366 TaxID=3233899 RepID=UPI003D204A6A